MAKFSWDAIVGHRENIVRLQNLIQAGKMSHALLFIGPEGIGKFLVAKMTAAALFCQEKVKPCGECASCRAFFAGTHPDFIVVEPDGMAIKIEQIRQLQVAISRAPYLSDKRVVIINQAEAMTVPAANSLLKTLEDPVGKLVFILVAGNRQTLLSTILSRCISLRFCSLSVPAIAKYLQRQGMPELTAVTIAHLADGSLGRAFKLQENGELELRGKALLILQQSDASPMSELWAMSVTLSELERGQILDLFMYVNLLLRDLLILHCDDQGVLLCNVDLVDELRIIQKKWTKRKLFVVLSEITVVQKMLNANTNVRLTIERFLLKLRDL